MPSIDVIVPVHGAGPVFRRCAASVIAHARGVGGEKGDAAAAAVAVDVAFRLVIVLDGPPDAESLAAVEELRAAARRETGGFELSVLTHEKPLGFVRSVNRGMRESTRDVVLLNSDTQVTAGWLGRLRAAAYSDPKIATVTPFSNNATICSLPRFLDENAIPAGHTIDSLGALVTRVSRREYPRLPTGVGFCLYVKRPVLDDIGLFDEAFGLGYGEEVDFCLRAARGGYVHVLDDATFVFHEGSRSFGRRRERRIQRGERMVRQRHSEYIRLVSEFIKSDPIAPARARVLDELRSVAEHDRLAGHDRLAEHDRIGEQDRLADANQLRRGVADAGEAGAGGVAARGPWRVLHVVQGWPPWAQGHAERDARWLVRDQRERVQREVFVYARMADPDRALGSAVEYVDGGVRVRLIVNNLTQRNPLSRFGLRSGRIAADFEALIDDIRPDVVHVHQLSGHALTLLDLAHRRHLPIVYELGDWWPLCARVDLIDRDGAPCSGPRIAKCAWCLPITQSAAARPASLLFYAHRARAMRAALAKVDAFVMGSQSIADRYAAARVLPASARLYVLPSPVPDDGPHAVAYAKEIERVYQEVMNQQSS